MMRKIDGTLTINLNDYEWMKEELERYYDLLKEVKRIDKNGTWSEDREYEIDMKELLSQLLKNKLPSLTEVKSVENCNGNYHIKAKVEV